MVTDEDARVVCGWEHTCERDVLGERDRAHIALPLNSKRPSGEGRIAG